MPLTRKLHPISLFTTHSSLFLLLCTSYSDDNSVCAEDDLCSYSPESPYFRPENGYFLLFVYPFMLLA
jgi:hypothetical protein